MELEKFAAKTEEEAKTRKRQADRFTNETTHNFAILSAIVNIGLSQLASALAADLATLRQELIGRGAK